MATDVALENCRLHRPRQLDGRVEIVVAGRGVRRFPARVSAGFGVCLKDGAAHDVVVEGRRVVYPANSVSLRVPGCVWASETGVHGFVSIDVAGKSMPADWTGGPMAFTGPGSLPDLAQVAQRLVRADDPLDADEILTQLLDSVVATEAFTSETVRDPSGPEGAVADACDFLRSNASIRPTLEATAHAAGVSKFTLIRRFRRRLGTTPHAYLVMVRVNHAQALLAGGASPMEAAVTAGFSDQAHLGPVVPPAARHNPRRLPAPGPIERGNSVTDSLADR
jgi:AraC-like DNA-binding protein